MSRFTLNLVSDKLWEREYKVKGELEECNSRVQYT